MGRPSTVRYREDRDAWVTVIGGKYRTLARGKRNRAEAVRAFHRLKATPESGERPASIAVAEMFDRLLRFIEEHRAPPTLEWYQRFLGSFLEHVGRETPANAVRAFHVAEWLDGRGWGQSTHNAAITAVKRAFRWGARQGYLESDPMTALDKPPMLRREAIMTPDDELRVIAEARGEFGPLLEFLRETGCRPSEAIRIEAQHVDRDARTATMLGKTSRRTRKPRIIYLTDRAVEIVTPLVDRAGPIFRNHRGNAWTPRNLVKAIVRIRERLGLDHGCTCSSFRHGWVTDAKLELPNSVVAELAGHTSTAMVDLHYGHVNERTSELSAAVSRVRRTGTRTNSPVVSPLPGEVPPAAPPGKTSDSARNRPRRS